MTELQLATGATKWLRSFGLAVVGLLLAGVMAISSFVSAQSAADGSDSEIDYAELSFVLIPLPLLLLSILSMFGREGATENEVRIAKRNRWLYRLGGVAMLLVTLNLTGII
jgi:hypothetical protein